MGTASMLWTRLSVLSGMLGKLGASTFFRQCSGQRTERAVVATTDD